MSKSCRPGLDDRCRDNNGEIRHKNGATRVRTLRETYGEGFAPGAHHVGQVLRVEAGDGRSSELAGRDRQLASFGSHDNGRL
jgi:hypothetical protein